MCGVESRSPHPNPLPEERGPEKSKTKGSILMPTHTCCDGIGRRDFLPHRGLGGIRASVAGLSVGGRKRTGPRTKAKSAIFSFSQRRAQPPRYLRPETQCPGHPSRRIPRNGHQCAGGAVLRAPAAIGPLCRQVRPAPRREPHGGRSSPGHPVHDHR